MKTISKIYLLGLVIALTQGCSGGGRAEAKEEVNAQTPPASLEQSKADGTLKDKEGFAAGGVMSDEKSPRETEDTNKMNFVHSSAARLGKIDSIKKFIRTADIKFKVTNVEKSTYKIEDIITHFDGFVVNTNLNCRINYTESNRMKEDSTLQRTHYVVENTLTFRVPKTKLDTTLKQIVSQIAFLDHRIITAEDVSFAAIKDQMHQKRFSRYQQRITKATDKSEKTNAVVNAENGLYEKEERADESTLDNLVLNDKVEYATVSMFIYQDERIRDETVFTPPSIETYQPSFGSEFVTSAKFGWTLVQQLFLLLIRIWPLLIIGAAIVFGIKRMTIKTK
jgi:hypothetical protein